MSRVRVIVVSPEEAYNGNAEFWCGPELMAVTVIRDGELDLRIDPRADGRPWQVGAASLLAGLTEARRQLASY